MQFIDYAEFLNENCPRKICDKEQSDVNEFFDKANTRNEVSSREAVSTLNEVKCRWVSHWKDEQWRLEAESDGALPHAKANLALP